MTVTSTGDLSQHFLTLRRTMQVKQRLDTLGQELASGRVSDVALHLGGEAARLAHIEHRSELIGGHISANRETSEYLAQMQVSLGNLEHRRGELAGQILSLPINITDVQREDIATAAVVTFEAMVGDLNFRVADRALFAGAATEGQALADAEDMLASLSAAVAGVTTSDQLKDAVDAWFNDPAGGFETMGYLGDTGDYVERPLGDGTKAKIAVRADDAEYRQLLAAVATAAVLDGGVPGLNAGEANDAVKEAGARLLSAAQPLSLSRGSLGRTESMVEAATTRQGAEQTSLGILRNDMISTDPFEVATELKEVQNQLEMNYMLTARLSGLSMAEYMR
ncbi:flagellin [Roseisalinus antarcticus]|uniref:Flagellar hook-associated protein FlgL n=1 Tax=Roseisalinus antarcticus TaxID=254357 RepID=A0A1Y5TKD2_9RHOB|nr:flagellin [Roseisalinus antarcticus]SLN65992.1 flagellar hook-associated protein FlgL [Roseisalinus antarcticus]